MARALRKTYQLKISLNGAKPPIWRRLLIADSVSLDQFHDAIQIAMGWTDSHLHQFVAGGDCYGMPDADFDDLDMLDESRFKLGQIIKKEKDSIIYEYDFGDGWEHKITLEKILPFDPKAILPNCVAGEGACPPEDVGGIWGYHEFLEALGDPKHPEHEEYMDWVDGEFDPQLCDIENINALLFEYCR